MTNAQLAAVFDEMADILEFQGANQFRVRAYRNAARMIGDEEGAVVSPLAWQGGRLSREIASFCADLG